MIKYRADQIEIMNYKEGQMAVQAVPGAGKTFIITNLASKLIKENYLNDSKILVLTYMNSAVNNFKSRIKEVLKDESLKNKKSCDVMTIHSLAVKIIKEKPENVLLNEDFLILDEVQKSMLLCDIIEKYKNNNQKVYNFFIKEIKDEDFRQIALANWDKYFFDIIVSSISKLKYKNINSKILGEKLGNDYKGFLRIVCEIYKEYEEKLKKLGYIDFDDLLILSYKSLKNDEKLRQKFKLKYKYIFEDECQDSNEIQGKIINLISCGNLVKVGDVNQSITNTFSMSNPKLFKDFCKNSTTHIMNMSNRSSKDIIEMANYLIEITFDEFKNKTAFEKVKIQNVTDGYKLNPNPKEYQIYYKEYNYLSDEICGIISYIKYLKQNNNEKSIGILVPYNKDVIKFEEAFKKENIDFKLIGVNSFYEKKSIIYLKLIIKFLINPDNLNDLTEVLKNVFLVDEKFLESLKNHTTEEIFYDEKINFKSYKEQIQTIKEILEYPSYNAEKLILFVKKKLNLEKEDDAIFDYLSFYFKYLFLENKNLDLHKVYEIISNDKNFSKIIETFYENKEEYLSKNLVTICNYHKSKGLEWDIVFLAGISDYNFPNINSQKFNGEKWYLIKNYHNLNAVVNYEMDKINDIKEKSKEFYFRKDRLDLIDEKLRLLYVGITRSKEALFFSNYKYKKIDDKDKLEPKSKYLESIINKISERR